MISLNPIYWVIRAPWAIPLILAMGVLIYGAGASVGAGAADTATDRDILEMQGEMNTFDFESETEEVEEMNELQLGLAGGLFGIFVPVFMSGFWFGFENPAIGVHMMTISSMIYLGILGLYVYYVYKGLREVFSWL